SFVVLLHWGYMHPDLATVEHLDELHRLIAESESRPVLLFKHSYTCGVSMEALDELVLHMNERATGAEYAMVTVQTHRAVADAGAASVSVRTSSAATPSRITRHTCLHPGYVRLPGLFLITGTNCRSRSISASL